MATVLCLGDSSKETHLLPAEAGKLEEKSRFHSTSAVAAIEMKGGAGRIAAMLSDLDCHCPDAPPAFHSWLKLKDYDRALRVERFMGIEALNPVNWRGWVKKVEPELPNKVDVIVLVDHNKGFRDARGVWKPILERYPDAPVVLRLHSPFEGGLLRAVARRDHGVVVVDGRDIRRMGGACVSRAISWEDTVEGFCRSLDAKQPHALPELNRSTVLVALFGIEGAVLQTRNGKVRSRTLLFDASALENQRIDDLPGTMLGLHGAVVCAMAKALTGTPQKVSWIKATRKGMTRAAKMAAAGFVRTQNGLAWPTKPRDNWKPPRLVDIPIPKAVSAPPGQWDLLAATIGTSTKPMQDVAYDVLVLGLGKSLPNVAQMWFGETLLTDRRSIEQYSVIRTLMEDYLQQGQWKKPLSIAVFGSPGSGKSFAVKQILKTIRGVSFSIRTINLSQCGRYEDLLPAFQAIRDDRIRNEKTPCVFFDEFDSSSGAIPWGWLKYFLAPMQDGAYADANDTHPLGGGLFFFAGGTAETFEQFAGLADAKNAAQSHRFKAAKGPDFISRLHGYLNVTGPNPAGDDDTTWPLRRAITLRCFLKRKCPAVFDKDETLHIDSALAKALLTVPAYIHGNRSMSRLVEAMSTTKLERLTPSALPAQEILKLHLHGFKGQ